MFYEHIKGFFVKNDAQSYLQRNKEGSATQDIGFF
jgi:hypothetical protein